MEESVTAYDLARIEQSDGHLQAALAILQEGMDYARRNNLELLPAYGLLLVGIAEVLIEQDRLEEAETLLQDALDRGQAAGVDEIPRRGWLAMVQLKLSQGHSAGALEAIQRLDQWIAPDGPPRLELAAMQAQAWLQEGRKDEVMHWVEAVGARIEQPGSLPLQEAESLTLARFWLAAGEPQKALACLEEPLRRVEQSGRNGPLIQLLPARVLALAADRDMDGAFDELARLLRLAVLQGYQRVFLDQGEPMRRILVDFRINADRQGGRNALSLVRLVDALLDGFSGGL